MMHRRGSHSGAGTAVSTGASRRRQLRRAASETAVLGAPGAGGAGRRRPVSAARRRSLSKSARPRRNSASRAGQGGGQRRSAASGGLHSGSPGARRRRKIATGVATDPTRSRADLLKDPSSAAYYKPVEPVAARPSDSTDPVKSHLIKICHINPRFIKHVKDLQVIQDRLGVHSGDDPDGLVEPATATAASEATQFLKSELHRFLDTSLTSAQASKAAWTAAHEEAFQACVKGMKDAKARSLMRSVKGRMGAFLRTRQFASVHQAYVLQTHGRSRKSGAAKTSGRSPSKAIDRVQMFMTRQSAADRMVKNFASTFTKEQQQIAMEHVSGHIVQRHEALVQSFLKERHKYLQAQVAKQRARIKKTRDQFRENQEGSERMKRFRYQVAITRRRLEDLYGPRWEAVLDAQVPLVRYGKERNAERDAHGKLAQFKALMNAKRSLHVGRALESSLAYALRVKREGGGEGSKRARTRKAKSVKRKRVWAATLIESIFRGHTVRLYAWAIRYLLSDDNLSRAFHRVVQDCGVSGALDPIGIVKLLRLLGMSRGVHDKSSKDAWNEAVQGVWLDLDDDGNGVIELDEFVPWFRRQLPRTGTVSEQLTLVQSVKVLVSMDQADAAKERARLKKLQNGMKQHRVSSPRLMATPSSPARGGGLRAVKARSRRAPGSGMERDLLDADGSVLEEGSDAAAAAAAVVFDAKSTAPRQHQAKRSRVAAGKPQLSLDYEAMMPHQTPEDALREAAAQRANMYLRLHTYSRGKGAPKPKRHPGPAQVLRDAARERVAPVEHAAPPPGEDRTAEPDDAGAVWTRPMVTTPPPQPDTEIDDAHGPATDDAEDTAYISAARDTRRTIERQLKATQVLASKLRESREDLRASSRAVLVDRSQAVTGVLRSLSKTRTQEAAAVKAALDVVAPDELLATTHKDRDRPHRQASTSRYTWNSGTEGLSGSQRAAMRVRERSRRAAKSTPKKAMHVARHRTPEQAKRELQRDKWRNSLTIKSYGEFLDGQLDKIKQRRREVASLTTKTEALFQRASGKTQVVGAGMQDMPGADGVGGERSAAPAAPRPTLEERVTSSAEYKAQVKRIDEILDDIWADDDDGIAQIVTRGH